MTKARGSCQTQSDPQSAVVDVGLVLAFVVEAPLAFNSFVEFKFE